MYRKPHQPGIAFAALAMLAGGMGMGGSSSMPETMLPLKFSPSGGNVLYSLPPRSNGIARGRSGGNQRQRRKDQRRAHAAGKRHAFA